MSIIESLNATIPQYEAILPFSKKAVTFTPFRVKDAKAITTILQEDNKKLAFKNMVEIIKAYSTGANINDLCVADAEYLFLQIRSKSVDEVLNLVYNGNKVQVNISEIKSRNEISEETLRIGNDISLVLRTPDVEKLLRLNSLDKEEIVKACIERIVIKNEIYRVNKYITEEIKELIDNLPLSILTKIEQFIKKQPELYLSLPVGDESKEVTGILNFFIFR